MVDHSKFTVSLLEKIGGPLLGAVNEVVGGDVASETDAATKVAQLLGQSVQMSTMLYNILQINEDETQADATRLALTALSAPLIADFYTHKKQIPTEDDLKQMSTSLQAVLNFAENFSPASASQSRLETIGEHSVLFDVSQPVLVTLQAMVPVINAVEEFSFGQSRRKLVQEISDKLTAVATDITVKKNDSDKLSELMIFKSLAGLYAECHRAETKRISTMSDEDRSELSVAPIWASFDAKLAMVEVLLGLETQDSAGTGRASTPEVAPVSMPVSEAAPVVKPVEVAAPAAAGPMGFFTKPKEGEAAPASVNEPAVAVADPVSAPVSESAPVASAPMPEAESPPSSPMGFFKPGAKKNDDGDA